MARWGEGDPRWIVEERPDATNVNNWHWSEKNASGWSLDMFKNLFNNVTFSIPNLGSVNITFNNAEGEAMVNNRKGKLIFFYEWTVKLDWTATADADASVECKGEVDILNLSEENDTHEIDIDVSATSGGEHGWKFKEFIRTKGIDTIREKTGQYVKSLKEEYASDVILPTKEQTTPKPIKFCPVKSKDVKVTKTEKKVESIGSNCGVRLETSDLYLSHTFKCTASEIYKALTVREMVVAFSQNDAKLEAVKGGQFELFGGNITGVFTELVPNSRIEQKWRFKTWPSGHMSEVVLEITQGEEDTTINFTQKGIPKSDYERTRSGWLNYYFESIKRTFGYGAVLV